MCYYDNIIVTSKIITILLKMILPFTGDTVLTVPTKDYTASKSMYTCTYVDQLLNTSLYAHTYSTFCVCV